MGPPLPATIPGMSYGVYSTGPSRLVSIRAATRAGYPLSLAQQQVGCASQHFGALNFRIGSMARIQPYNVRA